MTVLLCFCGASGGSTLFTLGNPYIMEIPRCLIVCVDMGIPVFGLRCVLQPFVIKTLSQAYALVRINPLEVGWLSSFFSLWVKKYMWSRWKPFFLWPTVFRWAVRIISWPSHQLRKYCVSRVPGQISLEVTSGIKSWSRAIALCVQRLFIHQSLDNISRISRFFYINPAYSARPVGGLP